VKILECWAWCLFSVSESCVHKAAEHSVHPTGGSLRVFQALFWLEVDSIEAALSRPTHQRVTPTVQFDEKNFYYEVIAKPIPWDS